ncbi:C-type mannose receptor 2-like [Triplophysa rosa]|uniref:C-type mannose receptor 2-like n=1 Tax=Triplophysa rosa TaxID=992332 RepID=UPI002545CB45|nr:C-type mannose receptor 2-like [Triplophysa rosa]
MYQALNLGLLLIAVCSLSECIKHQYYYINMRMNWTEAQRYCRENYTDLATVHNMNDMKELNKTVNNRQNVWIGLSQTTHTWKWSLGDPVNYTNWENGQPNSHPKCAFMRNGRWQSEICNEKLSFICYNGSSKGYVIENSNKTWRDAQSFCRQHHTDLTSVRSQTENENIVKIINNNETSVWIGLFSDLWEWSDNSNVGFRYWKSVEPNGGSDAQCTEVQMEKQGEWNDAGCHHSITFVCHEDQLILIKESRTWSEALKYCRENHMDLVSVHSDKIEKRLNTVVQHASTAEVWLGLRHSCTVGIWFWVSGEIVCYEKWAEGNETAVENCETVMRSGAVQSGGDHRWISLPETERCNFICSRYD